MADIKIFCCIFPFDFLFIMALIQYDITMNKRNSFMNQKGFFYIIRVNSSIVQEKKKKLLSFLRKFWLKNKKIKATQKKKNFREV